MSKENCAAVVKRKCAEKQKKRQSSENRAHKGRNIVTARTAKSFTCGTT